MDRSRVVVAEVLRARGNRGEVLARSQTDVPGRFKALTEAWLHLPDGSDKQVKIESAWEHKSDWVLKFAGVDSIGDADLLRGADVWVKPEKRAALADGEYYRSDLIGCRLVDGRSGELVGIVEGWQQHGGAPLLEVSHAGREVLVPFVPELCRRVDLEARLVTVDLPEGLLEL